MKRSLHVAWRVGAVIVLGAAGFIVGLDRGLFEGIVGGVFVTAVTTAAVLNGWERKSKG